MAATRRAVLGALAAVMSPVGHSVDSTAQGVQLGNQQSIRSRPKRMTRRTYLCLPGVAYTTIFANLPVLLSDRREQPTIIVDAYDYERLHGRMLTEPENKEVQLRGTIADALVRRGTIQLVDYAAMYPIERQDAHIHQFWEAVRSVPDDVVQSAAKESNAGYLEFGRGEYQQSFRSALGNWEINLKRRRRVERQQRKFERGAGNPGEFAENVFAQYIAGLEVRATLESRHDVKIDGVLGHGDEQGISTIIRESSLEYDPSVLALGPNDHAIAQIGHPDPSHPARRQRLLDAIHTVAQETTGVDDADWFVLGPQLAVPMFPRLVSIASVRDGLTENPRALADQASAALSFLQEKRRENAPTTLAYDAEKLESEIETTLSAASIEGRLHRAADVANYADDIRTLLNTERFSHGAILIAASILMDPQFRSNTDVLYRRARALQIRRRQLTVSDQEIEFFRNRGQYRRNEGTDRDWYHLADRNRH